MAEFAWPTTAGGKASTTATGKQVWAAAARAMGADDLAAALEKEKDWRFKYPKHVGIQTILQRKNDQRLLKTGLAMSYPRV